MPGLGRSPGKGNGYPLQYSNLENSTDGTDSPWGCKESDVTFTFTLSSLVADGKASSCNAGDLGSIPGSGRSLEKEMATHSSIHVWKILWTKEPGGLQSMGLQRVGHEWATSLHFIHRKMSDFVLVTWFCLLTWLGFYGQMFAKALKCCSEDILYQ